MNPGIVNCIFVYLDVSLQLKQGEVSLIRITEIKERISETGRIQDGHAPAPGNPRCPNKKLLCSVIAWKAGSPLETSGSASGLRSVSCSVQNLGEIGSTEV